MIIAIVGRSFKSSESDLDNGDRWWPLPPLHLTDTVRSICCVDTDVFWTHYSAIFAVQSSNFDGVVGTRQRSNTRWQTIITLFYDPSYVVTLFELMRASSSPAATINST